MICTTTSAHCARLPPRLNMTGMQVVIMAKYDGIKGQELLDVEEGNNEITLIFKDNRFLFVKLENGKIVCDSVPE
jgi:hypothetical protein